MVDDGGGYEDENDVMMVTVMLATVVMLTTTMVTMPTPEKDENETCLLEEVAASWDKHNHTNQYLGYLRGFGDICLREILRSWRHTQRRPDPMGASGRHRQHSFGLLAMVKNTMFFCAGADVRDDSLMAPWTS